MRRSDCMPASLCPLGVQARMRMPWKDWDEYLREHICKVPLGMKTPAPPTSVIFEEIIDSFVDSRALASKKQQTMPTVKGFVPLILSLLGIVESSPGFI